MPWGAAAAVVVAYLGYQASKEAGAQAGAGAAHSADVQYGMYQQGRADMAPYREAGTPALAQLMYLSGVSPTVDQFASQVRASGKYHHEDDGGPVTGLPSRVMSVWDDEAGIAAEAQQKYETSRSGADFGSLTKPFTYSASDFQADPGYEFRKSEGEKALTRGLAAQGLSSSTPGLKSLMSFNQDLASQEYSAAYGRASTSYAMAKSQQFNALSYLAGTGQNASALTGQQGVNTGFGMGGAIMAGANAQSQATMGGYSAIAGGVNAGVGNYMYQQRYNQRLDMYKSLFSQTGSTGGGSPSGGGGTNYGSND